MDTEIKKRIVARIVERKEIYGHPIDLGRLTQLLAETNPQPSQAELLSLLVEVYDKRSAGRFIGKFINFAKEHEGAGL